MGQIDVGEEDELYKIYDYHEMYLIDWACCCVVLAEIRVNK